MSPIRALSFSLNSRSTTTLLLVAVSAILAEQGCGPDLGMPNQAQIQRASSPLRTDPQGAVSILQGDAHLRELAASLGLAAGYSFKPHSTIVDELGLTHVRFEQFHRGIRIWEGDAIVKLSAQQVPISVIHTIRVTPDLSVEPSLSEADALRIARDTQRSQGPYASKPTVELIVYPTVREYVKSDRLRGPDGELNALDIERRPEGYALAYHIHTALENGAPETQHTDYIIDAHRGTILKAWSTLYTAAAVGTGLSQHSGRVSLATSKVRPDGFELFDNSRSMKIATYNLDHATLGLGTLFTDSDNDWGDGANYTAGSPTDSDNGQTAGVDAHYGAAQTFDYYWNVHGRNGIDGSGRTAYNRVHYGTNYDNAFWDDTCFCMTFGDGRRYKVLTSLDIAGHEMTHGVISSTAKLTYAGESGGLNESMSDIFGTMIEFYSKGRGGSTIGDTGGNWQIGEQLATLPLRYMNKPSKDRVSRDSWSINIGIIDPHYSSGPMNRAFYFLSQGASTIPTADDYSPYLPGGMIGIGNDKAARIAYRALTLKMTSSTNYAAALDAFMSAARELHGATSPEVTAVENAFAAINVGILGGDTTPPTTTLTTPRFDTTCDEDSISIEASASDNVGVTKVQFFRDASLFRELSAPPYRFTWNLMTVPNRTYALTAKAFDAAGNVRTSRPVKVTINRIAPICRTGPDCRYESLQPRPDEDQQH